MHHHHHHRACIRALASYYITCYIFVVEQVWIKNLQFTSAAHNRHGQNGNKIGDDKEKFKKGCRPFFTSRVEGFAETKNGSK